MFLEKKTFKFRQYIFTLLLSPLRKERGPSFEQTWITFALYYVWLKLAKWFWRRRYLNLIYILSLFFLSPLGKGHGPSFGQTWIPFTQEFFVPSLGENGQVVLEEKKKMWKVYDKDNDADDGQRTNCDQKS